MANSSSNRRIIVGLDGQTYNDQQYLRDNFGNNNDDNAIYAPNRTSVFDSYKKFTDSGILPQYQPVNYTPISGLGDDYYNNLRNQYTKNLNATTFSNPDSVVNQFTNTANKRGLIGSGVEVGGLNQIYNDYMSKQNDFESSLASDRAQNDFELSKFNTTNKLNTDFQNIQNQNALAELGLRSAGTEAQTATDFDTKMFEQQVLNQQNSQDFINKIMDALNDARGNTDISDDQRAKYGATFEDILAQYGFG